MYVALSRVNTLNGLLLTNTLNDYLAKLRISDNLLNEEKRLDYLDKKFEVYINWDKTKICFGFDELYYN